jgi:hypothetical protein
VVYFVSNAAVKLLKLATSLACFHKQFAGNMWGWYGDQLYPPLMSAWSKMQLGWVKVVDVKAATTAVSIMASCEGDIVYKIAYNMKAGEYFLVENRYPCGFDAKLAHHKGVDKDRGGIAIWHIDETDLLGAGKITYQSEGVCSGGQCPQHYRVSLVQSDGNFDMEKGVNKGDGTDLFRKRSEAAGALQGWKIDNNGVTLNNGSVKADTNTQGYAGTTRYMSGITIEVGAYEKNMAVIISLAGATGTNSGATPSKSKSTTIATDATTPPVTTTATCTKPAQVEAGGYGCPSTESPAITCNNTPSTKFLVTGIGATTAAQAAFQTKACRAIASLQAQKKHCSKLDYSKTDSTKVNHPYIWQTCQVECKILSKCT